MFWCDLFSYFRQVCGTFVLTHSLTLKFEVLFIRTFFRLIQICQASFIVTKQKSDNFNVLLFKNNFYYTSYFCIFSGDILVVATKL